MKFVNEDTPDSVQPVKNPNEGSKPTDARPNPDVTPADRGEGLSSVLPADPEESMVTPEEEQIEGLDEDEAEQIEGLDEPRR